MDYGDRRHIFISGTASIDNKGQIVHLSDVGKQLDRVLENINTLLSEAGAGMEHVAKMIVYLRDTADYTLIKKQLEEKHLDIPKVIVWAPVCRPGWLVEIECMAMKEIRADRFDKF